MDDRLIVALDLPDALETLAMAGQLNDLVSFYKIGLGSLATGGLACALELMEEDKKIFLDMKLFDIPATVERATRGLTGYGIHMLTVHGDPHVVRAAMEGRQGRTKILAVTILTALDRADLDNGLIKAGTMTEIATERAARAFEAGADGVVTSPREAAAIAALPEASGKLIVTPGIRLHEAEDDQKRTATPRAAIEAGATHLVVGRPVTLADNPRQAAEAVREDMARRPNAAMSAS